MDNRLRVAIAVSQNYYTILDRRKRYARHIDTLNEMKPDIEMTEIPMAPRLVAYRKKSDDYRKSQKKLDDECIAMLRKTYREREMARRHQKRPGTTRDWIAELGKVRTGKKPTPTNTFASNPPELRPLQSQRSYKTPAAAKIIFPDDNEQITANELYEPIGLEDGMQVTDQGPASARSQRSNYVSFGQYPVAPPNQPKSARGSYRNSGTIKEPSNDSSTRSKRKVLVSQTQTEPESQEYESDYLGESEGQTGQNKINTLGDTFESINSSLANTGKKNSDNEKESEKEESAKETNENESETKDSENNESENKKSEEEKEESEKEKSENNESEKHSDDMEDDFESTAKSDLNSTAKSDLNSTMKSDFDETDSKDENESENKDEDDDDDKKDEDEDDDDDKKDDDEDDDDDKKDDDDDDEDKSEDKKDDDDDDDDEEKESDPFAD